MLTSNITEAPAKGPDPKYPDLYTNTHEGQDYCVLFTSMSIGTVVYSNCKNYPLGYHSRNWAPCSDDHVWRLFRGSVSITAS